MFLFRAYQSEGIHPERKEKLYEKMEDWDIVSPVDTSPEELPGRVHGSRGVVRGGQLGGVFPTQTRGLPERKSEARLQRKNNVVRQKIGRKPPFT